MKTILNEKNLLRIGIVDDHLLFRRSMSLLINSFKGISVIFDAENGKTFLEKLRGNPIDIVLLDLHMPVMDGYEVCKLLLQDYPQIKILVVSQLSTRESIHKVMELGANGYFTKNSDPDQLESALRNVQDNGFYFGLELGTVIKEAMLWEKNSYKKTKYPKDLLSDRELQIIKMICKELSSKEIAERLFITLKTVETHRRHIMDKTDAKNFIGVLLFAIKNKILNIEEF